MTDLSRAAALAALSLAALVLPAASAQALPAAGLSPTGVVIVDTDSPGNTLDRHAVTGLDPGETVRGIDVRPANGVLYALGVTSFAGNDSGRLLTIDPGSGAAAPIGAPFALSATGTRYGLD